MIAKSIVITGISGLAGSHIARRLDNRCNLIGISRNPRKITKCQSAVSLDISDSKALLSFLTKTDFDIIINCAALADVDRCEIERDQAYKINTGAVATMAEFCKKQNRLLIHISTDYIFDGKAGPYPENAAPNPINYYGQTKLEAEEAIISSSCSYIIVRTNHLYGNLPSGPSKLVGWLLSATNGAIQAAGDQYNNATWAGNLADCIIELIDSNFRGVINVGGPEYLSRYEFALRGAGVFGFYKNRVIRTSISDLVLKAPRPLKAGLTIAQMQRIFNTSPVSVNDGLMKVRDAVL